MNPATYNENIYQLGVIQNQNLPSPIGGGGVYALFLWQIAT